MGAYEYTCTDSDGDGYYVQTGCGAAIDCDDSHAAIHPNATEVCNGLDNDCDGLIDEGCDSDADGLDDSWEYKYFGSLAYAAGDDPDGDGLTNLAEQTVGTNPQNSDTDGDGYSDGEEVKAGSDPNDAQSIPNYPPVADAGTDKNVITGQPVTVDGSNSFDPEGEMITFLWMFAGVPNGSIVTDASLSDAAGAQPVFTTDVDGDYILKLVVNDGKLNSIPDEVIIISATPNVAPNADAGKDQNVSTGTLVNLDGSASHDPDGNPQPLIYLWSFVRLPQGSVLGGDDIADRDKERASFIPDVDGDYIIRLLVSDGELMSDDEVIVISATPNVPPNADAGTDFNIYIGQAAMLNGAASNDPDHKPQPLRYSWRLVSIPATSGLTNDSITNAETVSASFVPDALGTYVLELMVSDGQASAFDNLAVTVDPDCLVSGSGINQPAPLFNASISLDVKRSALVTSWLKYYYTKQRISLVSTSITGITFSNKVVTVSGRGTVNGVPNYTFTVTITDGTPDGLGIEIRKPAGTEYFKDPAIGGTRALTKGNFKVTCE